MHPSSLPRSVFAAVLASTLATALPAQNEPVVLRAPSVLADALGVSGGTVQRLALPAAEWAPFETAVHFAGRAWTLELRPYDLRAEGFAVVETDGDRVREIAWTPTTYRGTVRGWPGSVVAANLYQGRLDAQIFVEDAVWAVEPARNAIRELPNSAHVVYRHDAVRTLPKQWCGVESAPPPAPHGTPQRAGALKTAEIAAELEPRFRILWGSSANALNQATAILNGMDAIYQRDIGLAFKVNRLVIRDAGYSGNNPNNVLFQMRSAWNAGAGEILRDLAHLFMGRPSSGVIGIAFLGTVCTSSQYSVSWHTSNLTTRTAVTSHEVGHSFNAPHCDGQNPCYIMCSFIGGCNRSLTRFGASSINRISSFANSRPCVQ